MVTKQELLSEIQTVFNTKWKSRDGLKVPEAEDVQLDNDAVKLQGTVFYADLADSTGLVDTHKNWFAAEVYKSYLLCACRIIRANGGIVTAFDGDRVMGVFIGESKNTLAVRSALQLDYAVLKLINPTIRITYKDTSYELQHAVGIDTSSLFVSRAGVRKFNDLVWIGRSANYAAKLCALRDGSYSTFITEDVFKVLSKDAKVGGKNGTLMWEKIMWPEMGVPVYRSSWYWQLA